VKGVYILCAADHPTFIPNHLYSQQTDIPLSSQ
jgi:hypothetical protein